MADIQGLHKLVGQLRDLAAKAKTDSSATVAVGYTAKYALFVHENIQMKWRGFPRDRSVRKDGTIAVTGYAPNQKKGLFWGPTGQAKFLEQPARELSNNGTLAGIIFKALKRKATMAMALVLAGLRIQRDSQKLVPVDTGNLRASAFTRLER